MKRQLQLGLIVVILAGWVSAPKAQVQEGCVTEKCHPTMGKAEWVHGPVGAGACTVCHTEIPKSNHKFKLVLEKSELCFQCHDTKRDMLLEDHVHTPVEKGECTGCHDPHQSDHRFQLKGDTKNLCFNCHDRGQFEKEFVHGPVAVGDCNACHNPHASPNEFQLLEPKETLCFSCHKEKEGVGSVRHAHAPVAEGCTTCHSPHSNDARAMLNHDVPELCFDCHKIFADVSPEAMASHPPVASGKCPTCHQPHGSDNPKMFPVEQSQLCFQCHSELSEYVMSQEYRHGPMEEGDCNACHNPHGSVEHKILREFFPKEFYVPYKEGNYALCFQCHNEQIAKEEFTKSLTDFRDQEHNLHFVHVNKQEKGRSCRACHQVHASSQPKHVRTSVPYGEVNWELPVTFTQTEDGGSCVVGCHGPKEYHR